MDPISLTVTTVMSGRVLTGRLYFRGFQTTSRTASQAIG